MTNALGKQISRGELYYADLSPVVGCEQGGLRPVLVIQNDIGNQHSPTVIAAAITGRRGKAKLPTHVPIQGACCGLQVNSLILLEQIRTLDRKRLREYIGCLDEQVMLEVDQALIVSLGISMSGTKDEKKGKKDGEA